MKALIFGAGKIGCGLAAELCVRSGYEVTFVARNVAMVHYLNSQSHFKIRLVSGTTPEYAQWAKHDDHLAMTWKFHQEDITIDSYHAIWLHNHKALCDAIQQTDLIILAVGSANIAAVVSTITHGLVLRSSNQPLNILAFENLPNATEVLAALFRQMLENRSHCPYGVGGVVIQRAVTQQRGTVGTTEPLVLIGDRPRTIIVDRSQLIHPLPALDDQNLTDHYQAWAEQKLFIYSAGHATTAYLGFLKGYSYIHSAIRDPEIETIVLQAMTEGQTGIRIRYGDTIAGNTTTLDTIIQRFQNAALNDPIHRVGRDPIRKLQHNDRLIGAARLAELAGVTPRNLSLASAAALYFYQHASQRTAIHLPPETHDVQTTLTTVCLLDPSQGIGHLINDIWQRMIDGMYRKTLLLSVAHFQWA